MTLAAGTKFGRYEIRSLVGTGGMGEVYLAVDVQLDRKVALKILPADMASRGDRTARFTQEAKAAAALSHPNIAHIYEVGDQEGLHYIAMEFIDGLALRERMRTDLLRLKETVDVVIQVASALAAAHAARIVHRDIKPENIMITRDGYVKVLDFGLAKLINGNAPSVDNEAATLALVNTDPGTVMGTAAYMSPEQAGGSDLDARTDIWSLGVVLYEMVAGHVPFEGSTPSHIIVAILEKEPLPLSAYVNDVPEALDWIVTDALTKDRDERTQTARELLKRLQRLKQRVDADAELGRSVAPHQLSATYAGSVTGGTSTISSGRNLRQTVSEPDRNGDAGLAAATNVSSAEYVVNQFKAHKLRFLAFLCVLVLVLAGAGFALYKFWGKSGPSSAMQLKVTPLTSSPHIERDVAFSPDGKHVAYVSTGDTGDNFDIYEKIVGPGEPLRLTTDPARDFSPTWSPDGLYIAFIRGTTEKKGVYIVPSLSGAERKVSDVSEWKQQGTHSQSLNWSPDGRKLVLIDKDSEDEPWAIFLVSIDNGERTRLTQPPAGFADGYLSLSPDGTRVAFVRSQSSSGYVYVVPITGGEPTRVTSEEGAITGLAWTNDGSELLYSFGRSGPSQNMWRIPATGGTPTRVGVGDSVYEISVSRQGDRLAYAQLSIDTNIYRLEMANGPHGRTASEAPTSFISSTRIEQSPRYSPDGRRIAFWTDQSGAEEIWTCDPDGKNLVQLTNVGSVHIQGPRWSPDSRFVAFSAPFNGNEDVFVVAADGGNPRRLTDDAAPDVAPSWSRDGRWIYFTSKRTGRSEIWKIPSNGGEATQLTHNGGTDAQDSPDGRTVYYIKGELQNRRRSEPGLWQVGSDGGEETRLFDLNVDGGNWTVMPRGIYFFTYEIGQTPYTLDFFDFSTRQTTRIKTIDGPRGTFQLSGMTVSPDERWVVYGQRDKLDFDLMLVDNFH